MKRVFLLFLLIAFTAYSFAQSTGIKSGSLSVNYFKHDGIQGFKALENSAGRKLSVTWSSENSTPAFVEGKLTAAGYSLSADKSSDAVNFISANKELFGLINPAEELKVNSVNTDELKMTHVKFDQYVNGIKIFPNQLVVHFNNDGSLESVNGNYVPTPDINTVPQISGASAVASAKRYLGSNYKADNESYELWIYRYNLSLTLVYAVKLPNRHTPNMKVLVNANTGEIYRKDDGIRYDGPVIGSGIGLNGAVRSLNTYLLAGKYYMVDAAQPMYVPPFDSLKGVVAAYDAKNDTSGNGYLSASLVFDPNNNNNFNDNPSLKAAVDAHYYSQIVYKFFRSHYGRSSYNNLGGSLLNVVHYKQNYNNAFWNGIAMTYGDGDGVQFSNLAGSLDVIAHELAHGVTEYSANLVYHVQPGAINEHVSDVFGVLVDSTNWLMGEDVYTPNIPGDALRNMQDPHNNSQPGSNTWQPAHMNEYVVLPDDEGNDWGGVHINSGIPNKAFYNVANVIGMWKSGRIWYRALTVYLTANSQFNDLRNACLTSAKDFYGQGSAEYNAVAAGFDNVGITGGGGGQILELTYDDGMPDTYVYETAADWKLAVKLTAPTNNFSVQTVSLYISGDASGGTGHFTLEMFEAANTGLPGTSVLTPYSYTPAQIGWQNFNITNMNLTKDFFISVKYDAVNRPGIGADNPPGNQRTYEYSPATGTWAKLTTPYDYTLFMRAKVKTITSVAEIDNTVPQKFEVSQNYPNPFNPATTIRYSLPEETDVQIKVYDINGNLVADLADNRHNAGTYSVTWNGKNNSGKAVSSGVYYYSVKAGQYFKTSKMVLLK